MLYLLAYRLFISAPPSSQSPSLCLSSSSPALSPCSFFYSCFLPYSLSSLSLSSGPHLPSLLSSCLLYVVVHLTTMRRFSYSESLTLGEAHVSLFSACLNLYLPSGCCAALSSLPHLTLMITFTNHSWEKLWFQHSPVLLSSCDRALKPFPTVVQHLLWWSDAFSVFIMNIRRKMQMNRDKNRKKWQEFKHHWWKSKEKKKKSTDTDWQMISVNLSPET